MYRNAAVGVVVPAYNEVPHVEEVLRAMPAFVDRVYAVDDCSTDDTWGAIRDIATEGSDSAGATPGRLADGGLVVERAAGTERATVTIDGASASATAVDVSTNGHGEGETDDVPDAGEWGALLRERTSEVASAEQIVAIRHDENRGAGGAIKTGYLAALADGVDVVATIDGDGQMDPTDLPRFLDPIVDGRADYTKGDRFADSDLLAEMPTIRLIGNYTLTWLTRIASGYWSVNDPQNGYTAVSTATLERIDVPDLFEYYGYCNEVLVRLNVAGATVEDVPMPSRYGDEESNIDFTSYVPKVSGMLLRNFLWRLAVVYLARESDLSRPTAEASQ